jgi:hypothetical protein
VAIQRCNDQVCERNAQRAAGHEIVLYVKDDQRIPLAGQCELVCHDQRTATARDTNTSRMTPITTARRTWRV